MRHIQHNILSDMPNVLKFGKMVSLAQSQGSGAYELSSESVTQLRGWVRDPKTALETMDVRLTRLTSALLPFHLSLLPTSTSLHR